MTLLFRLFDTARQLRFDEEVSRDELADLLDETIGVLIKDPPVKLPMTRIQHEILVYLTTYNNDNGYMPCFEEIAGRFNYRSLATVFEHLENLERKGYIIKHYNKARVITILP